MPVGVAAAVGATAAGVVAVAVGTTRSRMLLRAAASPTSTDAPSGTASVTARRDPMPDWPGQTRHTTASVTIFDG